MTTETKAEVEAIFNLANLSPTDKLFSLLKWQGGRYGDTDEEEHLMDVAEDWTSTYARQANFSQAQFVIFLNLCRNASWDIPSALLLICDHTPLFSDKDFPRFDLFPMHREPQSYWDNLNPWPIIDSHFKDIHNLDLTDSHINWNFDT